MRRREFVVGAVGSAVSPFTAGGQQPERLRRIGVLMSGAEDDSEFQARARAFLQGLQQFDWREGSNLQIDYRWGAGNFDRIRKNAAELAALEPEVILAVGAPSVGSLQKVTRTIPIVFANVIDPVGAGFIDSVSHPGGNTSGITNFEFGISVKWLEFLREVAPHVTEWRFFATPP